MSGASRSVKSRLGDPGAQAADLPLEAPARSLGPTMLRPQLTVLRLEPGVVGVQADVLGLQDQHPSC